MSASRKAKEYGLKNLQVVMQQTGWSRTALVHMLKTNPYRFKIVCLGVKASISSSGPSS